MDAFYASVEQRERPDLKGSPVVVGGDPSGRGVVAASSYEARQYGIHSAMPAATAIRLCPDAVFIKPQFELYRSISEQIRGIMLEYTDLVEPLSLDEAYLDVTENHKGNPSATLIARGIRERIREETGLTASAGVAQNKFLAKIASDYDKPDGLKVITPEQAPAFLDELPIKKFHGIGGATEQKMNNLGIYTGADLKQWSEVELVRVFGKVGRHYYGIVRANDPRPVKPERTRKSIGKEKTFGSDITDKQWLQDYLYRLAQQVSERAARLDTGGRTVTLKIRYKNFDTYTRSQSFAISCREPGQLYKLANNLLEQTEAGERPVRLLGLTLENLEGLKPDQGKQLEIEFDKA